ncbi:MAG: homoserine O-acetyltransferase [Victivallales bacterium]|nr:homoserine O-acetyltransferase [Victivallales bacterium]
MPTPNKHSSEDTTFSTPASHRQLSQSERKSLHKKEHKAPDDLKSVGWTIPRAFFLSREDNGRPFKLECGRSLPDVVVEYETYGALSPDKSNAILITHALSGDAHVAGWDRTASAEYRPWRLTVPGWWDALVGPGLPFDTSRFFIICANVLGSCYGTTGPASPNPEDDNRPYGLNFPQVTVGDWVNCERALVDHLGIRQLYAVVGGSLGGQQALEWAIAYPERVGKCIMLASGPKLPSQGLGFNHVACYTIQCDPNFRNGDIYGARRVPNPLMRNQPGPDLSYYDIPRRNLTSLTAARMLAHITYLSATGMDSKFGRKLQPVSMRRTAAKVQEDQEEFAVHGYLQHQGESFVNRFDANSYLYIANAMDNYDAAAKWGKGNLVRACSRIQAEMLVASFTSDWLYPCSESHDIVTALMQNHHPVTSVDVQSTYGHDAFLVEEEKVQRLIRAFLLTQAPSRMSSRPSAKGVSHA